MTTNSQSCNSTESCLIAINGLCDPSNTTDVLKTYPFWKQMHITESLAIPAQKPDIEQINSIDITVTTLRAAVIVTPRTFDDSVTPPIPLPNLEGKLLTGRKLVIEGQLCQKVVYTADIPDQPVHSAHFYVPFSSFIVVPKDIEFTNSLGQTVTLDALDVNFDVNACVEDVNACILDNRRIIKQVTLMLSAVPNQTSI